MAAPAPVAKTGKAGRRWTNDASVRLDHSACCMISLFFAAALAIAITSAIYSSVLSSVYTACFILSVSSLPFQ
jgi:hypothetical protein